MTLNISELALFYLVNLGIAIAYYIRVLAGRASRAEGLSAHLFWTAGWLLIFLNNWIWERWGLKPATIVADAGSLLLLGVYFSYERKRDLYRFFAPLLLSFLVVWMLTLERIWNAAAGDLFRQAIVYGPSSLLGMLAVASFIPVLYKHFQGAGRVVGLVLAAGYTLLQFPLFFIFVVRSSESVPPWLWPSVLGWRAGLFVVYWLLILTHAGVKVPLHHFEKLVYILSLLIPVAATLYGLLK